MAGTRKKKQGIGIEYLGKIARKSPKAWKEKLKCYTLEPNYLPT